MEQEKKENVQTAEVAKIGEAGQGAGAQKEIGPTKSSLYGKFASADALLQAYNSLQSEFTRRSQRLKELENELTRNILPPLSEPASGEERNASEIGLQALSPDRVAESNAEKNGGMSAINAENANNIPSAEIVAEGETADETALYERVKKAGKVRQRIIEEYLDGVRNKTVPLISGGMSVATPAVKAKTVTEAGDMALGYFRTRK